MKKRLIGSKSKFLLIISNNLNRFLVSRNYWYIRRIKLRNGKYACLHANSKLLQELLVIYEKGKAQGLYDSYVEKHSTKAE